MAGLRGTVLSLQFSANISQELSPSYISYRYIFKKFNLPYANISYQQIMPLQQQTYVIRAPGLEVTRW